MKTLVFICQIISNASPIDMAYEPGLTGSRGHLIHIEIDGDAPENINPIPNPEDGT